MQMFQHGTDSEGYSLIESIVAIFIFSLILLSILSFSSNFVKSSKRIENSVNTAIEKQNYEVQQFLE